MFERKKKIETKQFSVSQEDVTEIMRLASGAWQMQKLFEYSIRGFNEDIANMQKNIVAKLSIDTAKYDVDWATLFKDSKIYTHPKPIEKPVDKPIEEKKDDAKKETMEKK